MMEYLREFLIFLRKNDNTKMKPDFIVRLAIFAASSITIGVLMDSFLPFNFLLNGLRGFFASATGFSSFSLLYLLSLRNKRKKRTEDKYYQTLRKRFSYKQRINLSIAVGSFVSIFVFLATKENSAFTLTSSALITTLLILLSFARRNRNEFIKDIYELPDTRDLEFMTEKKNKQKERENKAKEK